MLNSMPRLGRLLAKRRRRVLALAGGVIALAVVLPPGVASAAKKPAPAVVAAITGPYGPMLVAGNGPSAGTALYSITSDYPGHVGCTTKVVKVVGSKLACTGPASKQTTEWPAYLTSGKPVAGPGVNASLLGEMKVKGLGTEVTYGGHPLYLFDSVPGVPTGENWDEATIPPWHGNWYLVAPSGDFLPWTPVFSTVSLKGQSDLATYMGIAGGTALFPVYTFSGTCSGRCADEWPPVIVQGSAGATNGVTQGDLGTITLANGELQETYNGSPLYFDGNEQIAPGPNGFAATGSGNGASGPSGSSGTFSLVQVS